MCDLFAGIFLRSLKRFAARWGLPHKFLSDNGKTFQAAAKFLVAVFKDQTVQKYLTAQGSQWIFNIEYALCPMVGLSVWAHGEILKVLPAKDDRTSKLHQRRVTDSGGGDWGSYQLMAPLVCIFYGGWRASHPFSPPRRTKNTEPSWIT